jgi:wobble nucleotide-excising tRNase
MLKKIDFIRNAGLYRSFNWGTLPELKRFNLFYGWNYSGKTTLSRILQSLERGVVPAEFVGCVFQVTHTDGAPLGTGSLLSHGKIRVFNRAFIENNFHQDMAGAKPVVVIGEENQKLKDRLRTLLARREKVSLRQIALTDEANRVDEDLKLKARDSARIVGELFGDRTYDRRNLLATTDGLPADYSALILEDSERDNLLDEWKRAGEFKSLTALTSANNANLLKSAWAITKVLKQTASYQAIERLKRNRTVEDWVRTGMGLHSQGQNCEFCGSVISEARWSELQGHFSEAYQELHSTLQSYLEDIAGKGCNISYHDESKIFPDLKPQYIAAKTEAVSAELHINAQIFSLADALRRKLQNLEAVESQRLDLSYAKQLRAAVRRCNEVISAHNNKVASADQVKDAARAKIINHYAADYATTSNYRVTKTQITNLKENAQRAGRIITKMDAVVSLVETEIKNASIAPQKINERLKVLMADDNIEAVKVSETDFEFRRNGQRATNMSEGERTAVSFAYFLAKLEEGGVNLAELIIVLDDPVCSFDSNHIFAVYSIVERNLSAAKQLIVLTHNADFFGLVKDWMKSREKSFYMVNRVLSVGQEWYSTVTPLPRLLEKFKSDYLYTYYCLKAIDDDPSPSLESMCGVPNTLRRLLETYLGFRYPEAGAWHEKLDRLMVSDITCGEIRKFTDEFSHSHYLRRAMEVPDYVVHCKRMVAEVLEALRTKDPDHIASLDAELAKT